MKIDEDVESVKCAWCVASVEASLWSGSSVAQ